MHMALRSVALIGALLHLFFFYKEAVAWNIDFVEKVAPTWITKYGGKEQAISHVKWATELAINFGTYNLVLAIGLGWVAVAGASVSGTLGIFLAVWLLGAAAAAYYTEVKPAFYV